MEWKNAKLFVIVLLAVMNLVLFGLNYQRHQQNVLTPVQEKAIFQVLSDHGISLYTDLITQFSPMRKVELSIPSYSKNEIKELFFGGEETAITVEFDKTIIKSKEKSLTLYGNRGVLVFPKGTSQYTTVTRENAQKEALDFMNQLDHAMGTFVVGNVMKTDQGFMVEFFQKYKGMLIFASDYKVYVDNHGISSVELTCFEPTGFVGDKKEICFSDEALFTFMKEYRKIHPDKAVTITKVELGYDFLENEKMVADSRVKLIPCYRIYVMEEETPYLINAYTNQLLSSS